MSMISEPVSDDTTLLLPTKSDGTDYNIVETNYDQKFIATTVLSTIIQWMQRSESYKPLRLTVAAGAGRGKSYLIHQLTKAIRKMFNRNDVVLTAAPTGAAAFNIHGRTCHNSFGISPDNPNSDISAAVKARLIQELRYIVAIFIDERSLLSAKVFGAAERNVAMTCHGGGKQHLDWGGVPVVIIWGDDYQLPSVEKGAFECLSQQRLPYCRTNIEISGMRQFLNFAENVITMTKNQRANDNEFIALQDRIRLGQGTDDYINTLLSLSLNNLSTSDRLVLEKAPTTMCIFATRQKCSDSNLARLREQHSSENPVAFIRSVIKSSYKNKDDTLPKMTVLCRGAKVAIKGRNFCPKIGLFNGAIGTVIEIVYNIGESPNLGHFPQYILVAFPSYNGPPFDPQHVNWVPIPTISTVKDKATVKYVPLELSYSKTIHKFQGYQAGPNNEIKNIICDPGTSKHESLFPGLLYTSLSRATTIGTATERQRSAIFFEYISSDRIKNLTTSKDGSTYKTIQKRTAWTNHLSKNEIEHSEFSNEELDELLVKYTTLHFNMTELDTVTSLNTN